jgi:hypothetical protein
VARKGKRCIQGFGRDDLRDRGNLEDLDVDGILKWIFSNRIEEAE